jgi:hypothetical protein
MRIVSIVAFAGLATAVIAMAPAVAGSIQPHLQRTSRLVGIDPGWRANSVAGGCTLKRIWKVDYAGNPYLKKVRVCA